MADLKPGIAVFTRQDPSGAFAVQLHHYESLRDQLDRGDKGWVELDSAYGDDGKTFLRLQDIIGLDLITESVADERNARALTSGE